MPLRSAKDGVLVAVRLQPAASRAAVDGIEAAADGTRRLKVRVTAAPEKSRANKALIKLLGKAWRVAPSDIEIAAGATDRNKLLLVRGRPAELRQRLEAWIGALAN